MWRRIGARYASLPSRSSAVGGEECDAETAILADC